MLILSRESNTIIRGNVLSDYFYIMESDVYIWSIAGITVTGSFLWLFPTYGKGLSYYFETIATNLL